ncbi:MAG: nucleotidyltransferase [Clostridia bacterium]
MKICAIICEYNPLHNGHKMQIQKCRELTNADYVICIMSGYFLQRGETAILDKYARASLAIHSGADIVIELPQQFATSSAEVFALGAIKCLNALNCVTHLCFGSESGDIEALKYTAEVLNDEPSELKTLIMQNLAQGKSHASSKIKAVKSHFENNIALIDILNKSNNILGVEYLRALSNTKSNIIPLTIKREGDDYNEKKIKNRYASATAIRVIINLKNSIKRIKKFVPSETYIALQQAKKENNLVNEKILNNLILYKLKTISENELKNIFSVNEGLENYIIKSAKQCDSYPQFLEKTITKRYGQQKLQRIAIHALLGITNQDHLSLYEKNYAPPYLKILATNDSGILSELTKSKVKIITRSKDSKNIDKQLNFTKIHENAQNIFNMTIQNKPEYVPEILRSSTFIKTK